jgi:hypothetical protein
VDGSTGFVGKGSKPGLPDGIFSNQKSLFGYILEGRAVPRQCWYFCGHSEHFTTIWYVRWPFGVFCVHLVHFPRFGMLYQEKSGNLGQNAAGS